MEKIKSIVDTVDFLSRYPGWLKATLGLWCIFSLGLLVTLVVLYPRDSAVRILRMSIIPNVGQGLALQFWVANTSEQPAAIVALELTFYARSVSPGKGSLQTTERISGRYVVTGESVGGQLAARVNQEPEGLPVRINFPIAARKDYALMTMDLAQKVPAKGTDRFQVTIDATGIPPAGAKYVEAVLHYDENGKTSAKELPL